MVWFVQVVVDSADPHGLADWWAETLGWVVEPQDANFIRSMIEQGFATDADTLVHHGALVWREGVAIHPDTEPAPDRLRGSSQPRLDEHTSPGGSAPHPPPRRRHPGPPRMRGLGAARPRGRRRPASRPPPAPR